MRSHINNNNKGAAGAVSLQQQPRTGRKTRCLADGDHVVAALEPGRPGQSKPRIRFMNKIDNAGNKLCNV